MTLRHPLVALGVACLLIACDSRQEWRHDLLEPAHGPTGTLRIELTDAPFPMQEIVSTSMTFSKIEIVHAGNPSTPAFSTRRSLPLTLDLLTLSNGATRTIFDEDVPVGRIERVKLTVRRASVTLIDGRTLDLWFPDDVNEGIEVVPDLEVTVSEDEVTEALLDFDLSLSFVPLPSGVRAATSVRQFMLRPVVRMIDVADAGSISGSVFDDGGTPGDVSDDGTVRRAVVSSWRGGTEVSRAVCDDDGSYRLVGLRAGTYEIIASARDFEPDTMSVDVRTGRSASQRDFRLGPAP